MEALSSKAQIVLEALKQLEATSLDGKVNAYILEDYILNNEESLYNTLKDNINEEEWDEDMITFNIKSINAVINALNKKGYIGKTEPHSIKVEGERRSLREYYLLRLDF